MRVLALGTGLVAAVLGALLLAFLPDSPSAAPTVAPTNTGEPRVSGTPRVGQIQRTTRGTWTGTQPIDYVYRWFRCQGRGAPDASDCLRIANALGHDLRRARRRRRLPHPVAGDARGTTTAPTRRPRTPRPSSSLRLPGARRTRPSRRSRARPHVGQRLTANRGTWSGEPPITYSFQWLRCSTAGDNCSEIAGATDNSTSSSTNDSGRTTPRPGHRAERRRLAVGAVEPDGRRRWGRRRRRRRRELGPRRQTCSAAGDRLVVSQVRFSPNPVDEPRASDHGAHQGDGPARSCSARRARLHPLGAAQDDRRRPSAERGDGWVEYQLQPLQHFPAVNGNVQFFVKAYRAGDPPLGGIAGYRLVQVRVLTAGQ